MIADQSTEGENHSCSRLPQCCVQNMAAHLCILIIILIISIMMVIILITMIIMIIMIITILMMIILPGQGGS